jgi:steroid delta-isomerase
MSAPTQPAARAAVDLIVHTFEGLTPERVAQLGVIYAPDATFKDPFNAVRGLADIQAIFAHMYVSLESPRFVITHRIVDGAQCFLTWEFRFRFRRFHTEVDQCIVGGSHLQLDLEGRITLHRDYWDAAEELYEKIPLLGALMRWLKRKANT